MYEHTSGNDVNSRSDMFIMISNFSKSVAKITFTIDKLGNSDILDLWFEYYDTVSGNNAGTTYITKEYNALEVGKGKEITVYTDLSYIGSIDSMIIRVKSNNNSVKFVLNKVLIEFGESYLSTADGYFKGLNNDRNFLFDHLTLKNQLQPYTGSAYYNSVVNSRLDSGVDKNNTGTITAHNDSIGEYIEFKDGLNSAWFKFNKSNAFDVTFIRMTLMKEKAGDAGSVTLTFNTSSSTGEDITVTIDQNRLNSMPAGEWTTFDVSNVSLTDLLKLGTVTLTVDTTGIEGQAIKLRNFSICYDEIGFDREFALTETDNSVDGLEFNETTGVKVMSEYDGIEYTDVALSGSKITADQKLKNILNGKYEFVLSLKVKDTLSSDFSLIAYGMKNGNKVDGFTFDLTNQIKGLTIGQLSKVSIDDILVLNRQIDSLHFEINGKSSDEIMIEYSVMINKYEYKEPDISFGIANRLVRDFTPLLSMEGEVDYDFSRNGFPEIGNWSDSFPYLRAQGQVVIIDEDGVPAMKIYRRSQAEINEVKAKYNWPTGTNYAPLSWSDFFVTSPVEPGYFDVSITVKVLEGFKGTNFFAIDGYMGVEPWYNVMLLTDELNNAPVGEWVTFEAKVYIPKSIDSLKIRTQTLFTDSAFLIKEVVVTTLSRQTSAFFDGNLPEDLSFGLETGGKAIRSVKIDEEDVPESAYTFENGIFTLKKEFLMTQSNGNRNVVISDGENSVEILVGITKIKPAVVDESSLSIAKGSEKATILIDAKNSGITKVELNGAELEEDTDYTYDSDTNEFVLLKKAIDALKEENTLDITTKAGSLSVTLKLTDKKSGNKKGCKNSLEIISWVSLSLISFSPIIIALKKKEEGYKNV